MRYILQRTDGKWEEVDSVVFAGKESAYNKDGTERYNGNYVIINDDGTYTVSYTGGQSLLEILAKSLTIKFEVPDYVKLVGKGGKARVHEVNILPQHVAA